MEEGRIIKDIRVLTEEFIPSRIVHRESQLEALKNCLRPITENLRGRNAFLYGPPGTGKTCIARFLSEELKEQTGISTAYVNCWKNSTRFNVLYKVVSDFGFSLSVHRKGTPLDELLYTLENKLSKKPCVVILDELDRIEGDRAVYDLLSFSQISLILIANTETVMYRFDDRIRSRLSPAEHIQFPPYTNSDIADILKDRVVYGLAPGVIKPFQLKKIAEISNGDARTAIGVLRNLAEHAEANGFSKIPEREIKLPTLKKIKLKELNPHQSIAYNILKGEALPPSELYSRYLAACGERGLKPVTERRLRTFLEELVASGLLSSNGSTQRRIYFVS